MIQWPGNGKNSKSNSLKCHIHKPFSCSEAGPCATKSSITAALPASENVLSDMDVTEKHARMSSATPCLRGECVEDASLGVSWPWAEC